MAQVQGKRVAVVGSGITGLSAAWLLHRNGAHVTLFEKESSCGGHTLTDTSSGYPVDLGFQVYNLTTYPNFVGFLEELGVDTVPSEMSFSLSMDEGQLEWASHDLSTVFAQRKNCYSPSFLRMLWDVLRFGREAPKVLEPAKTHLYRSMSLGDYLTQHGYSHGFIYNYVVPMCAAVWSVPNSQVLQFPVQMLIRFWVNHHLLDITQRPLWRVIKGRSKTYVDRVLTELPDVRTNAPVASVRRSPTGEGPVVITTEGGERSEFDSVVFATHSDTTLKMLGEDIDEDERKVLEAIPYNENDIYLHSDSSLMPRDRKAWASWNFLGSSAAEQNTAAVCVTYWANRLQPLPESAPDLFVTLNPTKPPAADKTYRCLSLAHPVFSFASWEAQQQVASLQGRRGAFYAGAWCGYGFHEDGIKAAVAAVTAMGATIPWTCRQLCPKISLGERFFFTIFDKYASSVIQTGYMRLILPDGSERHYGSPDKVAAPCLPGEEWRRRPALSVTVKVLRMAFFRKLVVRHDTGLGEAYMDGDFEASDLGSFLAVILANAEATETHRHLLGPLNWLGDRLLHLAHYARPNTIAGSRRNIEEHYDAGNAMYKLFLDESMMYSCAVWKSQDDSLYQAQMNKLDAIIDRAGITASSHVLEVGCGWGAFAIRAAQRTGCRVTGVTVSKEQLAEAMARVKAAGLEDRVQLKFCDYRDLPGQAVYDAIVSIEMVEAVGHEHLPGYFATLARLVKPGGRVVIQGISTPDERYEAYCKCSDFIREHVFPGGHLVCLGAMVDACRGSGLACVDAWDIGPDYALTLRLWREAWEARRAEVLGLGYSERFWRKFRFYFVYCEAGFDAKYIRDYIVTWVKDGASAPDAQHTQQPATAAHATTHVSVQGLSTHRSQAEGCASRQPADPITQALLALYFFLAGMLVKAHAYMWLLPLVSLGCSLAWRAIDRASLALTAFYRFLTPEKQARWCADVAHLAYSLLVSAASLAYLLQEPRALRLSQQPANITTPVIITTASTGFFAFHLWMSVRNRFYSRSYSEIVHFTLLLALFGVAAVKHINVAFLTAALLPCELSTMFLKASKLIRLAGVPPTSRLSSSVRLLEQASLVACRVVPHALVTLVVACSPSAFGCLPYYIMALSGMAFSNYSNWQQLQTRLLQGRAVIKAGKVGLDQGQQQQQQGAAAKEHVA